MAKIEKRFLSFGLVLALMVALSSVCFAEEFNFSNIKKSVDSNSWWKCQEMCSRETPKI